MLRTPALRESLVSLASEQMRRPRRWQAMFIRDRRVLLGVVDAPDRQAAEEAATAQFSLTAQEREHVVITERLETFKSGQRRPPEHFVAWVLSAMKRFVAWVLPVMKFLMAWVLPVMNRFVAWVLSAMKRFVAWLLSAMKRFGTWALWDMKRFGLGAAGA
jgi:hypothetical protein